MPLHRLFLKKYASIILLRNIDPTDGLCKCARLIVREFSIGIIDAEIATGVQKGKRVFIPRIILAPPESEPPFKTIPSSSCLSYYNIQRSRPEFKNCWYISPTSRSHFLPMVNSMLL